MQELLYNQATSWNTEARDTRVNFNIPCANAIRPILEERLRVVFSEESPISLPTTFVELGARSLPLALSAAKILQSYVPRGCSRLILEDLAYENQEMRIEALFNLYHHLGIVSDPKAKTLLQTKQDEENFLTREIAKRIGIELDAKPIPNFAVDADTFEYNLLFASLANYVPFDDLKKYLSDPRIRSVTFANGIESGKESFGLLFDPNRAKSNIEIIRFLTDQGFLVLDYHQEYDAFMQHPRGQVDIIESSFKAPAAAILVKPKNDLERNWLLSNQDFKHVDVFIWQHESPKS